MPIRTPLPAPDHRRVLAVAATVGVMGILFTTVPALDRRLKSTFNERLARHAETLPAGSARLETRRLAARGLEAVPPLARLAGSTNAAAADAARTALLSDIAGWESDFRINGDAPELAARLDVLANSLDRWLLSYDEAGRAWADRLTLNIVRDCDVLPVVDSAELLTRCDRILAAPPPAASPPAVAVATAGPLTTTETPEAPVEPTVAPRIALAPVTQPWDEPPSAALDTAAELLEVVTSPSSDVRLLDEPQAVAISPAPMSVDVSELPESTETNLPAPRVAAITPRPRPLPPPDESSEVIEIPTPQQARLLLRGYRQMSDAELSQQLGAASGVDARAIQQVLRERKLPTAAGPSPRPAGVASEAVERQILEQVSRLSPARGRQLLRTLATDATEDPTVRLQALALLATSDDPMLQEIARQRAVEDADPRVAELATRIMREKATEK